MLHMAHALTRQARIDLPPEHCHSVLAGFIHLVDRVSDVHSVESYPDAIYRVILKRLGSQLGAVAYGLHIAYDLKLEVFPDGVRASSLPRDPHDSWIGEDILLADYSAEVRWQEQDGCTQLDYAVEVRIDLPLPPFLKLFPRPLIQTVADAIMRQKAATMTDEMFGILLAALT